MPDPEIIVPEGFEISEPEVSDEPVAAPEVGRAGGNARWSTGWYRRGMGAYRIPAVEVSLVRSRDRGIRSGSCPSPSIISCWPGGKGVRQMKTRSPDGCEIGTFVAAGALLDSGAGCDGAALAQDSVGAVTMWIRSEVTAGETVCGWWWRSVACGTLEQHGQTLGCMALADARTVESVVAVNGRWTSRMGESRATRSRFRTNVLYARRQWDFIELGSFRDHRGWPDSW